MANQADSSETVQEKSVEETTAEQEANVTDAKEITPEDYAENVADFKKVTIDEVHQPLQRITLSTQSILVAGHVHIVVNFLQY